MVYSGSILYRKVLSPFYDNLVKYIPRSITPNQLTIMGGICCIISAWCTINDFRWIACITFTLYHMFDNMDGKHARRTGQSSEIGAILDHFCDGCFGILAGSFGLQYAIGIDNYTIAIGVFAFTILFYTVHTVHAFSGFFEIGNDYLSIDEAFLLISATMLAYAMGIKISILNNQTAHYVILGVIFFMSASWVFLHGSKVDLKRMVKRAHIILPGILYYSWMLAGGFQFCAAQGVYSPFYILWTFAIPYAAILWESKDKH